MPKKIINLQEVRRKKEEVKREKINAVLLSADILRPPKCSGCRFLWHHRTRERHEWCALWREDKDWRGESCPSGIVTNTTKIIKG